MPPAATAMAFAYTEFDGPTFAPVSFALSRALRPIPPFVLVMFAFVNERTTGARFASAIVAPPMPPTPEMETPIAWAFASPVMNASMRTSPVEWTLMVPIDASMVGSPATFCSTRAVASAELPENRRPPAAAIADAVARSLPVASTSTLPALVTAPFSRAVVVSLAVAVAKPMPTPMAPSTTASTDASATLLERAATRTAPVAAMVAVDGTSAVVGTVTVAVETAPWPAMTPPPGAVAVACAPLPPIGSWPSSLNQASTVTSWPLMWTLSPR